MPITASASTSCDTVIEPMRAASAEPERPATRIAVISAPNSRVTDLATATTTCDCAPNSLSAAMNWMPSISPIVKPSRATIGSASTPISRICRATAASRTGWPMRQPDSVKYTASSNSIAA